jgi:hypothetical protein
LIIKAALIVDVENEGYGQRKVSWQFTNF